MADSLLKVCVRCVQGYLVVFSRKIKISCLLIFYYMFFLIWLVR